MRDLDSIISPAAENRLVKMAANTSVGPQSSLQFDYDPKGRRIRKQVWSNTGWSGSPTNDVRFLSDKWNIVAELDGLNGSALLRSYIWGSDLSGSAQGAGGVGGLLGVTDSTLGTHFLAFDGNGNAAGLVKASDGTISANYEFAPFGEVLKASGLMAKSNPVRFSTKYHDDETDLVYYGFRYYNSSTGRWVRRDPLDEDGGINIYVAVNNAMLSRFDRFGLCGGGTDGHPAGASCGDDVTIALHRL